jgi:hypothetical protein
MHLKSVKISRKMLKVRVMLNLQVLLLMKKKRDVILKSRNLEIVTLEELYM